MRFRFFLATLFLILGGEGAPAIAQEGPGQQREDATKIVLLGVSHFTAAEQVDILSKKRQKQIRAVSGLLADWKPDRFFVECSPDEQAAFDADYQAYLEGDYDLTDPPGLVGQGEIYQLGFRTAANAGTGGVECADAETFIPDAHAKEVASKHNPDLLKEYRQLIERAEAEPSPYADRTVREGLLALNRDSVLYNKRYLHYYPRMGSFEGAGTKIRRESDELSGRTFAAPFELAERHMNEVREAIESVDARLVDSVGSGIDYVLLLDEKAAASESGPGTGADTMHVNELGELIERKSTTWVGFPDHHAGADMAAQWYKRNLRIYANIWHALEESDDRLILLIGQAHVWSLRSFFRGNPDFEVVPVKEVL